MRPAGTRCGERARLAGLERRGFEPDHIRRHNRVHTVSGQQPAAALLRDIDARIRTAVDDGVPMVRVLGQLGWEHPGWPAERDILSLEARVTDAVRNLPSVILCAYDVRALSGRQLLLGGFECHPLTLRRGALRHNEHHVAAEQLLDDAAARCPPRVTNGVVDRPISRTRALTSTLEHVRMQRTLRGKRRRVRRDADEHDHSQGRHDDLLQGVGSGERAAYRLPSWLATERRRLGHTDAVLRREGVSIKRI